MQIVIYVIALLCTLTAAAPAQIDAKTQRQLMATLHQMYEAEKKHDLNFIRSYLSDDFAEAAGDGRVYSLKDIEGDFADMELREYKLSDCVTKLLTSDAAYLSCAMEVDASFKGTPLPPLFRVHGYGHGPKTDGHYALNRQRFRRLPRPRASELSSGLERHKLGRAHNKSRQGLGSSPTIAVSAIDPRRDLEWSVRGGFPRDTLNKGSS